MERSAGMLGHGKPMVIGLGIDLVEVSRVLASLERYGERFLTRVFTEQERQYCMQQRHPAQNLAARFAAKEAGVKALGTGISLGIRWQDLEVLRTAGKAPELALRERARELADALKVDGISLSMTHTDHYATAVVVLEASGR